MWFCIYLGFLLLCDPAPASAFPHLLRYFQSKKPLYFAPRIYFAITSCDMISKDHLQWLKYLEFPQVNVFCFWCRNLGAGAWLCLSCPEAGLPLGWRFRCMPLAFPSTAPWRSQREVLRGQREDANCSLNTMRNHTYTCDLVRVQSLLGRTGVANKDRKSRCFTRSLTLLSISG